MSGSGPGRETARQRVARLVTQVAPQAVYNVSLLSSEGASSSAESGSVRASGATVSPADAAGASSSSSPSVIPVTHTTDVCIIGAGVLGSALAAVLGRKGYKVVVLERDWSEPDRIVGELMQPGGVRILRELGLGDAVEGIDGQGIEGYGVFFKGEAVNLPYPLEADGTAPRGVAFHHGRFVQRLRQAVHAAPNVTALTATVNGTWENAEGTIIGVNYTDKATKEKGRVNAWLTIACDGFASRFRKTLTKTKPIKVSTFAALVLEDVDIPFANHGHVILADPSPILCYPISSTEARLLVDIPNDVPGKEYANYIRNHMAPQMPDGIRQGALAALDKSNNRVRTMPNSYMPGVPDHVLGGIALGDSFNMRHPLTGAGMTVALADGKLLVDLLAKVRDLSDREATARALKPFYKLRKKHAATANILANALYSVFCGSDDEYLPIMQEACISYFRLNDFTRSGTMSLLGLMDTRPYVLVSHFFAVAAYGILGIIGGMPYPSRIATAFHVLQSATNVIKPLIDNEDVTVLSLVPNFLLGIQNTMGEMTKAK